MDETHLPCPPPSTTLLCKGDSAFVSYLGKECALLHWLMVYVTYILMIIEWEEAALQEGRDATERLALCVSTQLMRSPHRRSVDCPLVITITWCRWCGWAAPKTVICRRSPHINDYAIRWRGVYSSTTTV